jgi:hypothetical protein
MFPLDRPPFRQPFAHENIHAGKGFACPAAVRHGDGVAHAPATRAATFRYCYPSPFLWPDPRVVRPFFMGRGQSVADGLTRLGFTFYRPTIVVDYAPITTQQRGSSPCVNPLSSFPLSLRHWPDAYRMTAAGRLLAQASVRLRLRSPKMISQLGRPLALPVVRCATTRAFANNLTGHWPTIKGHPRAALGDFLHFAGGLCSLKS